MANYIKDYKINKITNESVKKAISRVLNEGIDFAPNTKKVSYNPSHEDNVDTSIENNPTMDGNCAYTQVISIKSSAPQDSRPLAIYVHGLASGAAGTTFNLLARKLKQYRWITSDFEENLERNVATLNFLVEEYHPALIVGISFGGVTVFYANAPGATKIVCNPALSIADCVRNTIGLGQHDYFCERIDGLQKFELTEEMCVGYENYIAIHKPSLGKECYAVFSAHDELLGDEAASVTQQVVADAGYKVFSDPKGVHRITSSTIKIIDKLVNK